MPLPPGGEHDVVVAAKAVVDAVGRQHPEGAAGDDQDAVGIVPSRCSTATPKIAIPSRGDEEVADVGVDERGGEVAPPVAADRTDEAAERREVSSAGLADPDEQRGSPGTRIAAITA